MFVAIPEDESETSTVLDPYSLRFVLEAPAGHDCKRAVDVGARAPPQQKDRIFVRHVLDRNAVDFEVDDLII